MNDVLNFQLELLALRQAYFTLSDNFTLYRTTINSVLQDRIEDVKKTKDAETQHWKTEYEKTQSFWNSKELWYGLGAATIIVIEIILNLAKQ